LLFISLPFIFAQTKKPWSALILFEPILFSNNMLIETKNRGKNKGIVIFLQTTLCSGASFQGQQL
jgi:hypothetical protein